MKVLVTGSSGLVGRALTRHLGRRGWEVVPLVRGGGRLDPAWVLEPSDAIVHLAGESISSVRWTSGKKAAIRSSRITGTRNLVDAVLSLPPNERPSLFLSASSIGFYGSRGDDLLDESSPPGKSFLADVSRDWEDAAAPLSREGIGLARLRFGMILSSEGGALAKMLPFFRAGLGGRLGSGRQWISWMDIRDAIEAIGFIIEKGITGPVNILSPNPVTNSDFTRAFARATRRPALIPLPAFAATLLFGEVAREVLLASQRCVPAVLVREGYIFKAPEIAGSLGYHLKRRGAP